MIKRYPIQRMQAARPAANVSLRALVWQPPFAVLVLFAFAIGLLWSGQSTAKITSRPMQVPRELGLWTGTPLEVTDRVLQVLETDDVSLMEYRLGQEPPVWFAQVAGFGNRAAFHPPELCYVGSHFEVLERGPITLMVKGQPRRLMRLILSQDNQRFEAWYWFTANSRVTPNYYQQQLWLLLDAIHHRAMAGTLIRISTPIDDPVSANRRLLAFVSAWDANVHTQANHGS